MSDSIADGLTVHLTCASAPNPRNPSGPAVYLGRQRVARRSLRLMSGRCYLLAPHRCRLGASSRKRAINPSDARDRALPCGAGVADVRGPYRVARAAGSRSHGFCGRRRPFPFRTQNTRHRRVLRLRRSMKEERRHRTAAAPTAKLCGYVQSDRV